MAKKGSWWSKLFSKSKSFSSKQAAGPASSSGKQTAGPASSSPAKQAAGPASSPAQQAAGPASSSAQQAAGSASSPAKQASGPASSSAQQAAGPAPSSAQQAAGPAPSAAPSSAQQAADPAASSAQQAAGPASSSAQQASADEEISNVKLEGLIQHLSDVLGHIKKNENKKWSTVKYWPESSEFREFSEFLSHGVEAASSLKDLIPTARRLLEGLGKLHWAAAGLLVVSDILERFEASSDNRNECIGLLDEMYKLAKYVREVKQRPGLREGMVDIIQEALDMIVEGSLMCSVQINSPKISRLMKTTVNQQELLRFQRELDKMYRRMYSGFDLCLWDAIDCRKVRPRTQNERDYPLYAVGIEEHVKEVTKRLDWESDKKAVAVVVYGFGGLGKTTLAEAVFARLYMEGRKYSMVKLFQDITSTPDISKLQESILEDLVRGTEEEKKTMPKIPSFEVGQREIARILEKEEAFIYIDNVLDGDRLRELLPRDLLRAKKLRVLITTREKSVCTVCTESNMEPKDYRMTELSYSDAMNLLKEEMKGEQLDPSQLKDIIEISGGIPKLLRLLAAFIKTEKDKRKAVRMLMDGKERLKGQAFDHIERYVFAYDGLPYWCQEPFLDICLFFKGMNWDSVADIVGECELDMLEKRALVSKDTSMNITVHDVILKIGLNRSGDTRFNSTKANTSQIKEFLQKKDNPGIKGLWLRDSSEIKGRKDPWDIHAQTLDSMSNSLKILRLGNSKVKGECNNSPELVFFEGQVSHLPFNISQMPSTLKYMELNGRDLHSRVFEISPSDCERLQNLRILRLVKFGGLNSLPEVLGDQMHELRELSLSLCTSIEELPGSFSKLINLRVLKMTYCPGFRRLPHNLGLLSFLQELDLSFCGQLEELPESTSDLHYLEKLKLRACVNLKHLPKDFELLNSLQVLELQDCKSLKDLPRNFEKFQNLKPFEETFSIDWLDDDEDY